MPSGSSKDSCHQDKDGENGHCAFEDLDHSVLQQPLNLGVTNVKQILKCIESGSREVKDIILNECNVIYECKACIGLFRSLANFLYHKRCYCKKHFCEDMLLFENFEEKETIVVQPEAPEEIVAKSTEGLSGTSKLVDCTVNLIKTDIAQKMESDVPKDEIPAAEASDGLKVKNATSNDDKVEGKLEPAKKAESSMISRRTRDKNSQTKMKITPEEPPIKCAKIISTKLVRKETTQKLTSKKVSQPDTSNKGTKKIELSKFPAALPKKIPSFPKIIFKAIDATPHAVYQSSDKKKLDTFGVNSEYEKSAAVETKVDNDKLIIVLKKDANSNTSESSKSSRSSQPNDMDKLSDFHVTRRKRLMSRSDCNVHELRCLTCKTQFMSLKTLYFHMLSLHSKKRLYYPCPFCKTLFVQMYGVTRHLIAMHNKTKEQINKLRDVIKKKSVWKRIDDVNPSNDSHVSPVNYQIKAEPQQEVKIETPPAECEYAEPNSLKTVIKVGKNVTLHQCSKCNRVFGRKSSQVSHQKFCIMNSSVKTELPDIFPPSHPTSPPMVSFLTSPPKPPSPKSSSVFQIKKTDINPIRKLSLEKETSSPDIKISIRPKRGAEKRMHKDFVNSQTLKWRSANRIETNTSSKPPPTMKKSNGKNLEKKVLGIMDSETLNCLKCNKTFSSYSNLRRHVAIHVGWTRFKCKYCDYQAYNKSQCWAHIQKTHSVDDEDMEKSIVNLVNTHSISSCKKSSLPGTPVSNPKKNVEASPPKSSNSKSSTLKVKISKKKNLNSSKHAGSEKKQVQTQKKEQPEVKKQIVKIDLEKEPAESKKDKSNPSAISVAKILKKEIAEIRKDKPQATITIQKFPKKEIIDNKKEKPQHIIPIPKLTIPDYKRDTNYKSVTTSNPTTIILSKKIPSSTVQSIVTISPESMSSPSKISPIRTSPRKNEIKGSEEKLITTLVTRSNTNTKITPIQIKLPERSNSVEEVSQDSADKNCSKKERLISEWFPKKDLSSTNIRRESAPLIIGLVPAANTGVNARTKNPAISFEKSSS